MSVEVSHVLAERKAKFDQYAAEVGVAYPNHFRPDSLAADLQTKYKDFDKEKLGTVTDEVTIAGRVMFLRMFGKLAFAQLQDRSGRVQASISLDGVGEDSFNLFKKYIDMGDLIGVRGTPTRTNTGELTIHAHQWLMLNKTMRPLPDKFHGMVDVEQRYRMRYVDLFMNEEVRDTFRKRSAIVQGVRDYFLRNDFMEVETPMLHHQASGAAARPFETHHNALDIDLALRIAPELHLKRLVVGGFERVFEINRNFRNEGISVRHNPEFTMMEAYCAHMDYNGMMELTENLLSEVTQKVCGSTSITYGEHAVDMSVPFKRLTMRDAIKEIGGATDADLTDVASMKAYAEKQGVKIKAADFDHAFLEMFEELCETKLINPTFITDYPKATSPLARSHDGNPAWAQRAEMFVVGRELANLFSELNDPAEQAARFREQVERAKGGDDEAMPFDHDYVRALEFGLMPTAGLGIGIDRLVMLLTNQPSIRDVILFPTLRPEAVDELAVDAKPLAPVKTA